MKQHVDAQTHRTICQLTLSYQDFYLGGAGIVGERVTAAYLYARHALAVNVGVDFAERRLPVGFRFRERFVNFLFTLDVDHLKQEASFTLRRTNVARGGRSGPRRTDRGFKK